MIFEILNNYLALEYIGLFVWNYNIHFGSTKKKREFCTKNIIALFWYETISIDWAPPKNIDLHLKKMFNLWGQNHLCQICL